MTAIHHSFPYVNKEQAHCWQYQWWLQILLPDDWPRSPGATGRGMLVLSPPAPWAFPTPSYVEVKKALTPGHSNMWRPMTKLPECIRNCISFRKSWHNNSSIVLAWSFSRYKFPLLVTSKKHTGCISPSMWCWSESLLKTIVESLAMPSGILASLKVLDHGPKRHSNSQACLR